MRRAPTLLKGGSDEEEEAGQEAYSQPGNLVLLVRSSLSHGGGGDSENRVRHRMRYKLSRRLRRQRMAELLEAQPR